MQLQHETSELATVAVQLHNASCAIIAKEEDESSILYRFMLTITDFFFSIHIGSIYHILNQLTLMTVDASDVESRWLSTYVEVGRG